MSFMTLYIIFATYNEALIVPGTNTHITHVVNTAYLPDTHTHIHV